MNNNKCRYLSAIFAFLLLITGGILNASPWLIESPQSNATLGRYGSSADHFLSTRDYVNLDFDKWFSVFSFKSDMLSNVYSISLDAENDWVQMAQLGFASRIGSLYFGVYYGGNLWRKFGNGPPGSPNVHDYSEQNINGKTMRVYEQKPNYATLNLNELLYNEASLLFGIGDLMGIRLSYVHTYQSNDITQDFAVPDSGVAAGYVFYKSLSQNFGRLNPELSLGLAKELIPGRGLKPFVTADLDFEKRHLDEVQYSGLPGSSTLGKLLLNSNNVLHLGLGAGLGGVTIAKVNNFSIGADFEYGFLTDIPFNNEYCYIVNGVYKTKPFKGAYFSSSPWGERSNTQHKIIPSFSVYWSGNRLDLSSRLGMGLEMMNRRETRLQVKQIDDGTGTMTMINDPDGTLVKHGTDMEDTYIAFLPTLDLAMIWEIVPSKLFLNAGSQISFGAPFIKWVKEQWEYSQGTESKNDHRKIINNNNNDTRIEIGATTELRLGISFYPIKNLGLQASSGVRTATNALSMFTLNKNTGGLLIFSSILATLQF